jgi:arylsulfatase A-like enzyme
MIVRWPGTVPAGRADDTPWMFADFLPTCAELAGMPAPAGLDGRSVRPLLTGHALPPEKRVLYWEFPRERLHQAVRQDHWKAVRYGRDQPLELYDLAADPTESIDCAAQHPDIVSHLAREMDHAHVPSPHWPAN